MKKNFGLDAFHIPLHEWVYASHLLTASKKGISVLQLSRMLGLTYKSAWFMAHRIREAMKDDVAASGPLGGEGKTVEADEAYHGYREDGYVSPQRKGRPYTRRKLPLKRTIVGLVERGGKVRSFHVKTANTVTVRDLLVRNADRKSKVYTDESNLYPTIGPEFASHETVKHARKETFAAMCIRTRSRASLVSSNAA